MTDRLTKRLNKLPLTLATAETYISQTADSFNDYLQMYEESWDNLTENSNELHYIQVYIESDD